MDNTILRFQKLAGLLTENIDEQDQLDEALKDKLLIAIMGLGGLFAKQANAEEAKDSIVSKNSNTEIKTMINDESKLKDALNIKDLNTGIDMIKYPGAESIETENVKKPTNYQSLTSEQRAAWNDYLDSLGDKVAGSPDLDRIAKGESETNGMKRLRAYLKQNPNSKLNDFKNPVDLVKSVQYEMNVIRKGKASQGTDIDKNLNPEAFRAMQTLLLRDRPAFMKINTSKEDGNPGQYTTRERYYKIPNLDYGSDSTIKKVSNSLTMLKDKISNVEINGQKVPLTK